MLKKSAVGYIIQYPNPSQFYEVGACYLLQINLTINSFKLSILSPDLAETAMQFSLFIMSNLSTLSLTPSDSPTKSALFKT
jgi:hypothetical protein